MTDKSNLGKLVNALSESPSVLKSFRNDPLGAAKLAGVTDISAKELDALAALSDTELQAIVNAEKKLSAALGAGVAAKDVIGGVIF